MNTTANSINKKYSRTMIIFIFGNPDLKNDSLPLKILPELRKKFPKIKFEVKDPNEEWEVPKELIIIDTILGINDVKIFDSLDALSPPPNISLHDFDVYANLRFLQKLGKLKKIKIIGVPLSPSQEKQTKIIEKISEFLIS